MLTLCVYMCGEPGVIRITDHTGQRPGVKSAHSTPSPTPTTIWTPDKSWRSQTHVYWRRKLGGDNGSAIDNSQSSCESIALCD